MRMNHRLRGYQGILVKSLLSKQVQSVFSINFNQKVDQGLRSQPAGVAGMDLLEELEKIVCMNAHGHAHDPQTDYLTPPTSLKMSCTKKVRGSNTRQKGQGGARQALCLVWYLSRYCTNPTTRK